MLLNCRPCSLQVLETVEAVQDQWLSSGLDPESEHVCAVHIGDQLRFTSKPISVGPLGRRQAEFKGVFGWVNSKVAGSALFLPRRCYRHASDGAPELAKLAGMSDEACEKQIAVEDGELARKSPLHLQGFGVFGLEDRCRCRLSKLRFVLIPSQKFVQGFVHRSLHERRSSFITPVGAQSYPIDSMFSPSTIPNFRMSVPCQACLACACSDRGRPRIIS